MPEIEDMQPITRGELRIELHQFEERFEKKIDAKFDAKFDVFLGALLARIDQLLDARDLRLYAELGRHTRALEEGLAGRIAVVDEKYAHLPDRVARLEDAAPPGKPRP